MTMTAPHGAAVPATSAPVGPVAGETPRRPGRPRQADLEGRVLDAVVALIDAEEHITVAAIVERSRVSRAAIYRRWQSLPTLVAAALDRGRAPVSVPPLGSAQEIVAFGLPSTEQDVLAGYPESRMRQRVRLGLADRELQREIWQSHVSRRRVPVTAAYERARESGGIRPDIDLDALQDLIAGMYYYQFVVRGDSLADPETLARCRAAIEIVSRGIAP